MTPINFWSPRFTGRRFEGHTLPVDVLKELPALKELLDSIAAQKFKEKHHRQRLPRNFGNDISLDLQAIDPGSTVSLLVLTLASQVLYSPMIDAYNDAKNDIIEAINQVNRNEPVTAIPREHLQKFDKVGRSLRADEAIIFAPDKDENANGKYTQVSRERLVTHSNALDASFTKEISLKGRIFSADTDKQEFGFEPIGQTKIISHIPDEYVQPICEGLARSNTGRYYCISGIGKYRNSKLESLTEISAFYELDELDVSVRLHELSKLKSGWLDGKGMPPSGSLLEKLSVCFEQNYSLELPLPYIYPTPEGGVTLEWKIGDNDISVEISGGGKADYYCFNLKTSEEDACQIDLEQDGSWQMIVQKISRQEEENAG